MIDGPRPVEQLRVALVHDWLTGMRGGENVLRELCLLFPNSRVYTMLWKRGSVDPQIERRVVQTSFLQGVTGLTDYRNLLPLFPAAIRTLRIADADLVISSSHAVAKAVRVPAGTPHLSYIHTPMRYVWGPIDSHFAFGKGRRWKRAALTCVKPYLKRFDVRSTAKIDTLVANSENIRRRVRHAYGRESEVVYPPADTEFFPPQPAEHPDDFYLVVSALEPSKRIDLAIEAFRFLDWRLVIVGDGTLRTDLRRIASERVEFAGRVSNEELRRLYRRCRALIVPGIEDFGLTPVEAQACGRPVVCYGEGGAVESVIDGQTGIHFRPQTSSALAEAIQRVESREWPANALRQNAERFSVDTFRSRMRELVIDLVLTCESKAFNCKMSVWQDRQR